MKKKKKLPKILAEDLANESTDLRYSVCVQCLSAYLSARLPNNHHAKSIYYFQQRRWVSVKVPFMLFHHFCLRNQKKMN